MQRGLGYVGAGKYVLAAVGGVGDHTNLLLKLSQLGGNRLPGRFRTVAVDALDGELIGPVQYIGDIG